MQSPVRWDHRTANEQLLFKITVLLPLSSVFFNRFETDMPRYSHIVGDLRHAVDFGTFSLQGSNAIMVQVAPFDTVALNLN